MSFTDPELGVIACRHVADGEQNIRFATRHQDGDRSFTCGQQDHPGDNDYVLIHVHHLMEAHPSLGDLASLSPGWSAERKDAGGDWLRFPDPETDSV